MVVGERGSRSVRMVIETVLSMVTGVGPAQRMRHRVGEQVTVRIGFLRAAFNLLVQGDGLPSDETGRIRLSRASVR